MTSVVTGTMAPAEAVETTETATSGSTTRAGRSDHRLQLMLGATTIVAVRVVGALIFSKAATATFPLGPFYPGAVQSWTAPFLRWDSNYFIAIAQHGYSWIETYDFLPVYPLLIRAVSPVFGYAGGAIAVSWIASIFAVWGVMDVTERFASRQLAWVAGALLMWNPVSIFLLAGYAEALLVALMIWSLRFCLDGKWWPAAITAGLASGVLPQGVASAVVLVVAVLMADRSVRGLLRAGLFGLIGLAGCVGYLVYCWVATGNPLKIRDAETVGWQAHLTYPLHMVFVDLSRTASWHFLVGTVDVSKQMRVVYALDSAVGLLAVIVAVSGFVLCRKDHRFILPATLFLVGLVISVVTVDGAADSTARFILFLAPFYVIVAVVVQRLPRIARLPVAINVLMLSAASAVFFGAVFNLGYWLT
jgi:hypothetical protein